MLRGTVAAQARPPLMSMHAPPGPARYSGQEQGSRLALGAASSMAGRCLLF